jgi:hypothetical protein
MVGATAQLATSRRWHRLIQRTPAGNLQVQAQLLIQRSAARQAAQPLMQRQVDRLPRLARCVLNWTAFSRRPFAVAFNASTWQHAPPGRQFMGSGSAQLRSSGDSLFWAIPLDSRRQCW